jgi:hypothetical protein
MLRQLPILASNASASGGGPLGGHGWHTVEAMVFLVMSLGGIAAAEYVQARNRRTSSRAKAVPVTERIPVGAGISGSAGLPPRPIRSDVTADPDVASEPARRTRSTLLPLVAVAGAAAAAVHFVVMPEHFEEATLYGTFFAVAATSQLIYSALLLARPSRILLAAGALGNTAIVVLWLITRTSGIPLGPGAGDVESVGGLDILATIFEVTTAVGAIALLWRRTPMVRALRPSSWSPLVRLLLPSAAVAIAYVTVVSPPS